MPEIFNPNPVVFSTPKASVRKTDLPAHSLWINDDSKSEIDADDAVEPIDQDEIFGEDASSLVNATSSETFLSSDLIRFIYDPEHPNTLEELRVVSAPQITISTNLVNVEFTPTVPHCGMSTLIGIYFLLFLILNSQSLNLGLCIRVRLLRSLPERYKVDIVLKPGSHQSENAGMFPIYVCSCHPCISEKSEKCGQLISNSMIRNASPLLWKTLFFWTLLSNACQMLQKE